MGRAIDMFNADKRKYRHYTIDAPDFAEVAARYGGVTPEDLHLPRLRYTKDTYYSPEIVEDTYHWMVRWGLLSKSACTAHLVDNRVAAPEPVPADD